jgi:chromosome segregation ATPase
MPKNRKRKKSVKKKKEPYLQKRNHTNSIDDLADISEERASIISIVQGLEGQVETAFQLREVLEAELDTAQKKLSEECSARAELEAQFGPLESQVALADQLRGDISFAEEERNKFANLLTQTQEQLEEVTADRNSLTDKIASVEAHAKELEDENVTLGVQLMNLKDKITDIDRLRKELEEEAKELRGKIADADIRMADLRTQIGDQEAANREVMKTNTHLENEIKMVNIKYEALKNELAVFKDAIRDIRSEASQTSGRLRQKYLKPGSLAPRSKKKKKTRKKKKKTRKKKKKTRKR